MIAYRRMPKRKIFVGLSGGVDSSVAAWRLLQQGYDVVGVFIKVWQPEFLSCNWEQERRDAMRIAAYLHIPFLTCDAEAAYRQSVAEYFIREYAAGRTPNPDVMCNKYVKFGAFREFASSYGVLDIATGHYAQISSDGAGQYFLRRGEDDSKDQSYFLWTIPKTQLPTIHFPIGDSMKVDVRKEAARVGLPTAQKSDSQGICFLGQVDIPAFLSHFIDIEPGVVCDLSGTPIGTHRGALTYTIGQRTGLHIKHRELAGNSHYVHRIDLKNNCLYVSSEAPVATEATQLQLQACNQIVPWCVGSTVNVQYRYRQLPVKATLLDVTADTATLRLSNTSSQWAAGQSCVLYQDDICLGGGIIV